MSTSMFFPIYTKADNFYDFLFAFMDEKAIAKLIYLNPMHSEKPKLYAILVFLSAIGLTGKERIGC